MSDARIPLRRFYGESMQSMLMGLHLQWRTKSEILKGQGYEGRSVLGFKLPEWQRPAVWTDTQCADFIESVYVGASIGTYMVNESWTDDALNDILIDGQQRLTAIERYWSDEFPLIGEDGQEWYWSQLTKEEQAHFMRIPFPFIQTKYEDEMLLKEAYNRHNFSGTPHDPDDKLDGAGGYRDADPQIKI